MNNDVQIVAYHEKYKAQVEDLLILLVDDVAQYNELRRVHAGSMYGSKYLEEYVNLFKNEKACIYLATIDVEVVGCIAGKIIEKTGDDLLEYYPMKLGFIDDLYVLEDWRGHGIGAKLLQESESFFKQHHCVFVDLLVAYKNSNAHELYLNQGFKNDGLIMRKKLQ
ncbi:MAG: GCN5-related N-acetyltransferase [Microgenomates group bacterium GW2011_GWF2_45_18]|nr:MAG: GCN5-related N-acetyltransferase [Microgenomates group bacterium GW2011_GWF1_44_10]KKU02134.1 MAG: GCN5-related N-acetyltransferase [Microgenomates group bacterium GW2011_GWF2_45_18]OGJ41776.1 MAG: hypothetical protein A2378_00655 [Candidatus Pacebacteria bacterium RIFOXYB1_FULL_44_10]HAU98684.1 hypothetical protein [Candidatus Paceibacterota bacterium]HAX01890.1 hypothetical protein [Candidatus Paceibacterota bacterium]